MIAMKQLNCAGTADHILIGHWGVCVYLDLWWQLKGRGSHEIMGLVKQRLLSSFRPMAVFSWVPVVRQPT